VKLRQARCSVRQQWEQ